MESRGGAVGMNCSRVKKDVVGKMKRIQTCETARLCVMQRIEVRNWLLQWLRWDGDWK